MPAKDADGSCSPVTGVNAHLRFFPSAPEEFRVVVTFHRSDGSLCEALLSPLEAAGLMAEIVRAIDQGNGEQSPKRTRSNKGDCHGR